MILETIRIAFRSLYSNKLRTLLSMLGIVIGVGAVIAVVSIASGTQEQVTGRISQMGSNVINIDQGYSRFGPGRISAAEEVFTLGLGSDINEFSPAIKRVIPVGESSGLLTRGNNEERVSIIGTEPEYQELYKYFPQEGKFFTDYDLQNRTSVIVLGEELASDLFGDTSSAIGEKVSFNYEGNRLLFSVVGVMQYKERGMAGDLNSRAYIPVTTYLNKISNNRYVSSYVAQAYSGESASGVDQIDYFLSNYLDDEEEFQLNSQEELLNTISDVTDNMRFMLIGIAAISLLVGGIGIMNIMLVSVTERTREIGIRKALGAKRRHIMGQFLAESVALCSIGGIIGIILGLWGSYSISKMGGWPFIVNVSTILIAVSFSMGVGIFFGIYPAFKASKLDPVESLSYE